MSTRRPGRKKPAKRVRKSDPIQRALTDTTTRFDTLTREEFMKFRYGET